jgi:alkanesulfonate monooxygenase SsuD/methylene tetrahydromethanopterin reductase-like flavin-dependent oxidoreductase (luciferase family)
VIGTDDADVARRLDAIEARVTPYLGPDSTRRYMSEYRARSPFTLIGTPAEIVARLDERRELGLGYSINYFPEAAYDRSGLELFAAEVMPALR